MKTILCGICGIALMVTICYSILGLFPSWSSIIPLIAGFFLNKKK